MTLERRDLLVSELMKARRAVKEALSKKDHDQLARARHAVHAAKVELGERGPVWWTDGISDYNRYLIKNSPYAAWYQKLEMSLGAMTSATRPAPAGGWWVTFVPSHGARTSENTMII